MCRVRRFTLALLVAAGGLSGAGRLAAQQPQTPQPPPFRSGVQVVEVDVRVFDRDGRFVTTLTRDDFEVLEDGVPQQVVAMALVGAPAAAAPGAEQRAPRDAAGQTSNQQPATNNRHTWVFFFDLNHLTPGSGFDRARKAAAAFIRDRFREGDMAGVVGRDGMVNNRLTTVREELVKAVESVKPSSESRSRYMEMTRQWPRLLNEDEAFQIAVVNRRDALDTAVRRACADEPESCGRGNPEADVREKAGRVVTEMQRATLETLKTINGLATGLARMPGPKTIVFLSDGFAINGMETTVRSIVGQVGRAGARVYAIDVRGLDRGRGNIIDQAQADSPGLGSMNFDAGEDGINSLAIDTGGMMIRNENNLDRALDRIAADTNLYYVLGYQPANTNFDGKYRKIEIRVKRPAVSVRSRHGYLALDPAKMLVPQPIRRDDSAQAPAQAPESPVPSVAPAAETASAPVPPAAAVVTDAATTSAAGAPVADVIRVRPDAAERVRALSEADSKTSTDGGNDAAGGWSAYQRGDLESALPLFERAATRPDARPWALYALGLTYAGVGKPREAIGVWQRMRRMAPDYAPVYMDLAATYASLGDLSAALGVLRDAEKRWPRDPSVHNGIGVILVRREALDHAIEAFTRAAAVSPDDAITYLNLGRAYELRYMRGRRFVTSQHRWVAPDEDRRKAAEAYRRCIALGGPYAARAEEALRLLEWQKS